jgi:hypothetical protein
VVELVQNGSVIRSTISTTSSSFSYEFVVAAGEYTVRIVPKDGTYCLVTSRAVEGIEGDEVTADFACFTAFGLSALTGYDHNTGTAGQSKVCGRITTAPSQTSAMPEATPSAGVIGAGASYSVQVTGPTQGGPSGIVPGQAPITGVLGSDGTARYEIRINRFGTYTSAVTVTSVLGVVRTASADVTVGAAAGTCP